MIAQKGDLVKISRECAEGYIYKGYTFEVLSNPFKYKKDYCVEIQCREQDVHFPSFGVNYLIVLNRDPEKLNPKAFFAGCEKLGVQMKSHDDSYRPLYDIFKDLARLYNTL